MTIKPATKKIKPRPKARMGLEASRRRINRKYGETLAKLAK